MYILYSIIVLLALFFIVRAIVHTRRTHIIANNMKKKFEHNFNETAYHNDQHNDRM